jgi:hypothetical protein
MAASTGTTISRFDSVNTCGPLGDDSGGPRFSIFRLGLDDRGLL